MTSGFSLNGRRRRRNSNPIGLAIGLLIIGIILFFVSIFMIMAGAQSNSWAATDGIVTSTSIREKYDSDDGDYTYYPEITYSFQVDGKTYTGDRWDPTGIQSGSSIRSSAQNKIDKYPVGSTVTVYYDPNNPNKNALTKGVNGIAIIMLVISIIMVVIGIVILAVLGKILSFLFKGRSNRGFMGRSPTYTGQSPNYSDGQVGASQTTPNPETAAWFGEEVSPTTSQSELTNEPVSNSTSSSPPVSDTYVESAPAAPSGGLFMSKKNCPSCGHPNEVTDKFCGNCGTQI